MSLEDVAVGADREILMGVDVTSALIVGSPQMIFGQ
jgi:hypothetical protein